MGIRVVESNYAKSKYLPLEPECDKSLCSVYAPKWQWHKKLKFDPKASSPPVPRTEETWLVGIVQNVLYSVLSVEYYGLDAPIAITWSAGALDSVASADYQPFTRDPWTTDPSLPFKYRAAARISYGPEGIERLPDLGKGTQEPVGAPDTEPVITLNDRPGVSAPVLFKNKYLKRIKFLDVFKLWVMAQSPRKERFALVNSDPYTLIGVGNFDLPKNQFRALDRFIARSDLTVGEWDAYPVNGIVRSIPAIAPTGDFKTPPLRLGEGSPRPIYSGQTANDRARQWMLDKGLAKN